jgi:hypothetical protein
MVGIAFNEGPPQLTGVAVASMINRHYRRLDLLSDVVAATSTRMTPGNACHGALPFAHFSPCAS